MKRIISLLTIATFALSSVANLSAQTRGSRLERSPRRQAPENQFGTINASSAGTGVLIEWQMTKEKGNMGFRVFRIESGVRVQINEEMVYGSAIRAGSFPLYGEKYSTFDREGGLSSAYVIEGIDLEGRTFVSSTISTSFSSLQQPIDRRSAELAESGALRLQELTPPPDVVTAIGTPSFVADPDTHRNVVMSRPGVRLGVKKEGIYRVAAGDLQAAGFNTASDPVNWQLYVNGVQQAITVGPGASYVEFYGNGIDTIESDIQGYFLVVGDAPGKRIRNSISRPSIGTAVLPSYDQSVTFKERIVYVASFFNGPAENFFGRGITTGGANINLDQFVDLTGIDYSDPESTLELRLQGFNVNSHIVRVTLNGQIIGNQSGTGQIQFGGVQTIPTSLLRDKSLGHGPNTLNLTSIGPAGGGDISLFDSVSIKFSRKHKADTFLQKTLKAYTVNSKKTMLTGFASPNTRVFDISRPDDPKLVSNISFQQQGTSYGATIPAGRAMSFFAVEDSAILAPVSITSNDGELLGVSTHEADLIIISHRDFMAQAQAWAEYRREDPVVDVEVVNFDEIADEFNYGVPTADSIEAFLNYAYNNWQGDPPQYVLLIGDGTYDPRGYLSQATTIDPGDYIPNYVSTRIVSTTFSETASDESLADFDDDGLAELAVGRIPARQPSQVTDALTKTMNWEDSLGTDPLGQGALFASHWDTSDPGIPEDPETLFQEMSKQLRDKLPPTTTSTMMHSANSNHLTLTSTMNTGKYIVNYSGHGSAGSWASTYFQNTNVPLLTNNTNESLFTMLTCLNGDFTNPDADLTSLAENLLNWNNGGAVAAWSSTGLTTTDLQMPMGLKFYEKIGQGDIPRLGDLIKVAKGAVPVFYGTDVRLSWSLLGDPMLKVR